MRRFRLRLPVKWFGAQAANTLAIRLRVLTSLRAAVRPLVRMPTNRHAATGTCEIGRAPHKRVERAMQEFFCFGEDFFANAAASVKRSLLRSAPPRPVCLCSSRSDRVRGAGRPPTQCCESARADAAAARRCGVCPGVAALCVMRTSAEQCGAQPDHALPSKLGRPGEQAAGAGSQISQASSSSTRQLRSCPKSKQTVARSRRDRRHGRKPQRRFSPVRA